MIDFSDLFLRPRLPQRAETEWDGPSLIEMIAAHRPAWHADALCKEHPHLNWFPKEGQNTDPQVREICNRCPVRDECLEHALSLPERHGVWGGLSARQLSRARAERRNQERAA